MKKALSLNKYRILILLSGKGSNLQAIIDQIAQKHWPIEIAAVISDQAQAYGLERAKLAGIPTAVLTAVPYPNRQAYNQALKNIIENYKVDLIVLAGFMRILSPEFVNFYQGRLINIHPSLLPKYKGLNTHQRVLESGDTHHGISVHFVTEELDGGPLIAQMQLEIHADETPASLEERIHVLEHKLYPIIIHALAEQRCAYTQKGVKFENRLLGSEGWLVHESDLEEIPKGNS